MMAELMERRLATLFADLEEHVVTYVPTSSAHRRRRGYDQAELLARALAGRTGLAFAHLLERRRQKRTQVSLHPQQRMANVRDAFSLRPGADRLHRGNVLLVDDVLTTGATARAAAETLARAGVGRVALVTFARALPR
ncbi:MAG: phosphoribosyltransferase family protein [Gammaproteobacteria bacterium]|nr:phosphoribosyltransferase family protein [Gammaproteobacteria bacterium]MDE0258171.1 phosphoribosyltransferase family protein [Gammaproteobacteria bacterium]